MAGTTEERIKARFRVKYKTIALSNKTLDALAAKVATKIPEDAEESAIDSELDFLNDLHPDGAFLAMQKADDKAVNDKRKQEQPQPPADPELPKVEAMPEWFKPFADKVQAMEAKEQRATKEQTVESLLKDLPKSYRRLAVNSLPENPEEHTAWADEHKAAYTADVQQEAGSSFGDGKVPRGTPGTTSTAIKSQMEEFAKEVK